MILIAFLNILSIKAKGVCEVVGDELTLAEFYKEGEALHELMEPVVQIVSKVAEANNTPFKVQKINCGVCKCEGVERFPTFQLVKKRGVVDSFFGFKPYDKLVKFLSKEVDEKLFYRPVDTPGEIVELEEKDFYSGFEGAWLILFYFEEKEETNRLLKHILRLFEGRVRVGKVRHTQSQFLTTRFQIRKYPTVYGMFEGVTVPFLGDLNPHDLVKFTERLIEPTFKSISYGDMLNLSQDSTEPIYIALHEDENKANETFFRYAHNFKFKTRFYKSNDPQLFRKASVFPREEPHLVVFKNGKYHVYEGNVNNEGTLVEWIFHTHFPNVTKISPSSFHSVFNGIKPVFLLLTENDFLNQQLEAFARDVHLGKPFLHLLFSSLNLDEYVLFTASLLPKIKIPTFVVYNPMDKKFYHREAILNEQNFKDVAEETLRLFESGRLRPYGENKRHFVYYFLILGCVIVGMGYFLMRKRMRII